MSESPSLLPPVTGRGAAINPLILQPMLESAPNAAEKGQSQFFTPVPFGRPLAAALPAVRPAIVDLNCGAGALLQASALPDTEVLLGSDIDPCTGVKVPEPEPAPGSKEPRARHLRVNRLTHDLTRLYPLLKEVGWTADLFVLNPPWRLWWHRDRLQDLTRSELPAVREAFANLEEGAYKKGLFKGGPDAVGGTIDSTIATLLIALDLCTYYGEGMLIANNDTLERLIFTPGAPHAAVAKHIWAHVVVPGNPMTGIDDCLWEKASEFQTGVIYFAASHDTGPQRYAWPAIPDRCQRLGSELRARYHADHDTVELWNTVNEKVAELNGQAPPTPYNLWLTTLPHRLQSPQLTV